MVFRYFHSFLFGEQLSIIVDSVRLLVSQKSISGRVNTQNTNLCKLTRVSTKQSFGRI